MKTIINQLAQSQPGIKDREAFAVLYRKHHSAGPDLTDEDCRQAFAKYSKATRKIKRVGKGRDGTVGPDRISR